MKKLITLISIALLSVSGIFAQVPADSVIVAQWQLPVEWWFPNTPTPAEGIAAYPRIEAKAYGITSFDPAGTDFDATWASISGTGYAIGATAANTMGLAASNKGAEDFKNAAYKVVYDESNMYIMLQWTDDDVTGSESAEICLAPYFKLDAPDPAASPNAWYSRWLQFGGSKLKFNKDGFSDAMFSTFDSLGVGKNSYSGTTPTMTDYLFLDNKTAIGSKTVKWIITIGYPVLTGEYRPDFNVAIWQTLNAGKGISFDLKVNDVDTDDALSSDNPPVAKPAEYWWNATSNDCWQSTIYAGFLGISSNVNVAAPIMKTSIFNLITHDRIELNKAANVFIYNIIGQPVLTKRGINQIDLSTLKSGVYIIKANNESMKFVR
jgi:hypothetical protein